MTQSLETESARTVVSRVVARADEITRARSRGVTWRRIVDVIGHDVGVDPTAPTAPQRMRQAHAAAVRAIAKGRLTAGRRARTQSAAAGTPAPGATSPSAGENVFEKFKI